MLLANISGELFFSLDLIFYTLNLKNSGRNTYAVNFFFWQMCFHKA